MVSVPAMRLLSRKNNTPGSGACACSSWCRRHSEHLPQGWWHRFRQVPSHRDRCAILPFHEIHLTAVDERSRPTFDLLGVPYKQMDLVTFLAVQAEPASSDETG